MDSTKRNAVISKLKNIRLLRPVIPAGIICAIIIAALSGYEAPVYEAKTPELPEQQKNVSDASLMTLPGVTALPDEARTEAVPAAGAISSLEEIDDSDAIYQDGTYTGSAQGFGGPVSVSVTIEDGKITSIVITSASGETPEYFSRARAVIDRIINHQSTNVDVVSGATYSSNGIIGAVRNALAKAMTSQGASSVSPALTDTSENPAGNTIAPADPVKPAEQVDESQNIYRDGTYTGTAQGYGGEIKVRVTISDQKIVSIEVTEHKGETRKYFEQASVLADQIVAAQSTNVDTVSGATLSSNGIINAVRDALNKAKSGTVDTEQHVSQDKQSSEQPGSTTDDTNPPVNPDPSGEDDPQTDPSDDPDSEDPETPDVQKTITVSATVYDLYEDFWDYTITMNVVIRDGIITDITDLINTDHDATNALYLKDAAYGTKYEQGVITQILSKGLPEDIDTVSEATCSSKAIIEAANKALEQAAQ